MDEKKNFRVHIAVNHKPGEFSEYDLSKAIDSIPGHTGPNYTAGDKGYWNDGELIDRKTGETTTNTHYEGYFYTDMRPVAKHQDIDYAIRLAAKKGIALKVTTEWTPEDILYTYTT
jgi:hypothetical protein